MLDLDWLLAGDPSVRWQTLRDLTDAPVEVLTAEHARSTRRGWGATLLALRTDAAWATGDGLNPGCRGDPAGGEAGGEVLSGPLAALTMLRDLGIDPRTPPARELLDQVLMRFRWPDSGRPFFAGSTEPCVDGRVLAVGAYFGVDTGDLAARLVAAQRPSGHWSCVPGPVSLTSAFPTTLCVLEGLAEHARVHGASMKGLAARRLGCEFLLRGHLFQQANGAVVEPDWLQLSFPTGRRYDVLRALDHLRVLGGERDHRLGQAIAVLRGKRHPDSTWSLDHAPTGPGHLAMEVAGQPSRWITLRALRVLRWYDGKE